MIELMIGQKDGLDSDCSHVICLVYPMYVYVLNSPICRSLASFVVRHCTLNRDRWRGTEYVLLPCVKLPCAIICVPLNIPGSVFGVCCTCAVLYCCWVTVFGGMCVTSGHTVDIQNYTGTEETTYVPCCKRMSPT